jgi:transcriptional regulator with XRE-family HTH domain
MRPSDPVRALRDVGRRIAELRVARGLTQEALSVEAACSLKYWQAVEAGRENLTVKSLVRIANLLRVSLRELFKPPKSRRIRRGRPPARG